MRFDPYYAPIASGLLGLAHYMLKQYSQALPLLRDYVSQAPNGRSGHAWLAATHAQLGQLEEARAEAAEVLRLQPNYTIAGTTRSLPRPQPRDHPPFLPTRRACRSAAATTHSAATPTCSSSASLSALRRAIPSALRRGVYQSQRPAKVAASEAIISAQQGHCARRQIHARQ
jgi:tetratricopeptide (TPR) repeat protein